jgi:hypothetical protein
MKRKKVEKHWEKSLKFFLERKICPRRSYNHDEKNYGIIFIKYGWIECHVSVGENA